jgi:hypothetical protein
VSFSWNAMFGRHSRGTMAMKENPKEANSPSATPPKGTSFWQFINSSFGIFLLSSVFVGLLSFSYGQWRDYKTRGKKTEQLDFEIALRLQTMDQMASGGENTRYSNLANMVRVMNGDTKSSFYVRKPVFDEFNNKTLTSLLWQLYLLAPIDRQERIKNMIREVNIVSDEIRQVRLHAVIDLDDEHPKPRTRREQERHDEEDDIFKKDYGQWDVYKRIHSLSQTSPWKDLVQ